MLSNVSFSKIQIQSAVQPDGNHSFVQVKRAMASYSSEPALSLLLFRLCLDVPVGPLGPRRITRTGNLPSMSCSALKGTYCKRM